MPSQAQRGLLLMLVALLATACTLSSNPPQSIELTDVPTSTVPPTRTPQTGVNLPTALPFPTSQVQPGFSFPTSVAVLPPTIAAPASTPLPIRILILSPVPGSVVAGNVQVLGAASHPQFLQYQVEYGPDPNPGNLWFPASSVVQSPVQNGLLGIWNTTVVQDATYQVRLKVILRDGTSLATVVNNIRVQNQQPTPVPTATTVPRPIAAFRPDRTTGLAPLVVRFDNQSSGSITSYRWNFGDGSTSSTEDPTHTFRTPGVYEVQLRANGPGGQSNVSRQIRVQSPNAPVANFTQDRTSGEPTLAVQFTDSSTGTITERLWTFGDGTTSTEANPRKEFTEVGTYNVILEVTGPGGVSSARRQITVEDRTIPAPEAQFAASTTEGEAPLQVQFTNESSGDINEVTWTFGDLGESNIENPQVIFEEPGEYDIQLLVVGDGGQDTASAQVAVSAPPDAPDVEISSVAVDNPPLTIQFNANMLSGEVTSWSWDFGDGNTSDQQNPSHTYGQEGTYLVSLTAEGPGGTDTETHEASATLPLQPPTADFGFTVVTDADGPVVAFENLSAGEGTVTYNWNFGDNNTSNEEDPTHQFPDFGTYTVSLTASNEAGSSQPASKQVEVLQSFEPAVAAFSVSSLTGVAGVTEFVFDSSATTGDVASYAWMFGDPENGNANVANPTYTYQSAGNFTVTLTVTGADGGISTDTETLNVSPNTIAIASVNNGNPTTADVIQFTGEQSSGAATYLWDFGDGSQSGEVNPQKQYTNAGQFQATLTVTGADGVTQNTSQPIAITVSEVAPPANPVIVFATNREGNSQLFVMDADGGNAMRAVELSVIEGRSPDWSVNNEVVYEHENDIYVVNLNDGNVRRLTNDDFDNTEPVWSPDGNAIAFSTDREEGDPEIFVMDGNGGNLTNVTNNPGFDGQPAWSRNNQIAFASNRTGNNDIFVMGADGSNPVNLTADQASQDNDPSWNRDSNAIAFVTNRDGGDLEIYVMDAYGGYHRPVTSGGSSAPNRHPTWTSEGRILFVSERDGNNEIYIVDADGNNITNLTNNGANDEFPAVRP